MTTTRGKRRLRDVVKDPEYVKSTKELVAMVHEVYARGGRDALVRAKAYLDDGGNMTRVLRDWIRETRDPGNPDRKLSVIYAQAQYMNALRQELGLKPEVGMI